jgi:RND family efflux transporter MFP subunit
MKRTLQSFIIISLTVFSQASWAQSTPPAPVAVDEAKMDTFSASLWVSGTVISRNDARIGAETEGRITWVAEVGEQIEEGSPIARIDATDLKLELQDNQAMLESLRARGRYLKNNLDRLTLLASRDIASANQLDEARAEMDMNVQNIKRAEITAAQTSRRIDLTQVMAPFSGIVAERRVQVGEFVGRGAQVARLVDTRNREIRAQAPLSLSGFLQEGLEVSVEHQDVEMLSPIKRVIPVGDERSRMFEVWVAANNPDWVVGSSVRVALPNSDPRKMVAVPRDALVLRGSEMFILKVTKDNLVERVSVVTGIGLGPLVEVIGDVDGGDRVITRGAERLQPGQEVIIAGG